MNAVEYMREKLADKLRRHGINPTRQRVEIAYALFSRQSHLSADQVLAIVNEKHSETSKATVYNTLKLFRQKKLVREVIVDPARVFYDPNTEPHYHIFNVESGELTDIDASEVEISGLPDLPGGVVAEGMDVVIRVRPAARKQGQSPERES